MKALLIAFALSVGLDTASTCYALNTGKFIEAMPLTPKSCKAQIVLNSAILGSTLYFAPKTKGKGRKVTKWFLGVSVGARSAAVTWNLIQINKY